MINYRLRCANDHVFEGWFRSSADFDTQSNSAQLSCPICFDHRVEKTIMAPAIARSERRAPVEEQTPSKDTKTNDAQTKDTETNPITPETLPAVKKPEAPVVDERTAKIWHMMREVQRHVEANFENVGKRFADEARKMHVGESEQRGVYGEATIDDAKELLEEGIEILPLPKLPKLDG